MQTKIGNVVTNRLSKNLNTRVSIDKVALNFIDRGALKGIYLEDQSQDTLIFVEQLNINIAFFKLIRKNIEIDHVKLGGGLIKIRQEQDSSYNFNFLLEAFSSEETDTSSSELNIVLNTFSLDDINMIASTLSSDANIYFSNFLLDVDRLDLLEQTIDISKIKLEGFAGHIHNHSVSESNTNLPTDSVSYYEFPLSTLPLSIKIKNFDIVEASLQVSNDFDSNDQKFDPSNFNVEDFDLQVQDIFVSNNEFASNILDFKMRLNEEFVLSKLQTNLKFDTTGFSLIKTFIATESSQANFDLEIGYQEFNHLLQLEKPVNYHLNTRNISINLNEAAYFVPEIKEIQGFKSISKQPITLTGDVRGNLTTTDIKDFRIEVNRSSLSASGTINNIMEEKISFSDINLMTRIKNNDISPFLTDASLKKQIRGFGDLSIDGNLEGTLQKLNIHNISFNTSSMLRARISGTLNNLTSPDNLSYDLNIHEILTGKKDALNLLDTLPSVLVNLDTLSYSGKAKGGLKQVNLDGLFVTNLGNIDSDFEIQFNEDYTNGNYSGTLEVNTFNLRRLLENDSLGWLTMDIRLDGSGLSLETIDASIDAKIVEVDYKNYHYQDFSLEGIFKGKKFNGKASFNDPNLKFDFLGNIDLNDSIPKMDFDLQLDTLNLLATHLYQEAIDLSMNISADFVGQNLDQVNGFFKVHDIRVSNRDKKWKSDSLIIYAEKRISDRGIYVQSDFMNAVIEGSFELSYLSDVILNFLDNYFPASVFVGRSKGEDEILDPEEEKILRNDHIKIDIAIKDIKPITSVLGYPLTEFDSLNFFFDLNVPDDLVLMNLDIPLINYDGLILERIKANAESKGDTIIGILRIDTIQYSDNIHLSQADFNFKIADDKAILLPNIMTNPGEKSFVSTILLSPGKKKTFRIDLQEPFYLNNKKWNINQRGSITLDGSNYAIPLIQLKNKNEALKIEGDQDGFQFDFVDFKLGNIVEVIGIDSLEVQGEMNGSIDLGLSEDLNLKGDLDVDNIYFNEFEIGNLTLDSKIQGELASTNLTLKGQSADIMGNLDFDLIDYSLKGSFLLNHLYLEPFQPFLTSFAKEVKGEITGNFEVAGSVSEPDVKGELQFSQVEAYVVPLNSNYKIQSGSFTFNAQEILPQITLVDEKGRTSNLKGNIAHQNFNDIILDLNFKSDMFTFLDSSPDKKELFYGSLVGKIDADITGNLDNISIKGTAVATNGTDLTIQLLDDDAVYSQESYMVFYDGNKVGSLSELDSIASKRTLEDNGFDLILTLSTTDEALFHVIVDPVTGDRLDIRGTTDLKVNIPKRGNMSIVGDYIVSEGKYALSYENTIRRNFTINPGSSIRFKGDPYDAILDLTAIYSTKASVKPLVYMSSTNDESNISNAKANVNIEMLVDGPLSQPNLSFNIAIPNLTDGAISNDVNSALNQFRQNETMMLEQVFSLFLFNSFVGGSSGTDFYSAGRSTAISSLGNLINRQLNKIAQSQNGLEIDFQADQYDDLLDNANGSVTQLELDLSKQLLNERLILSIGGDANLSSQNSSLGQFSQFAGDFEIQYKLTENGKYRIKVFQRLNYNNLQNNNSWKSGVGVTYKSKFGKVKEKDE